jgi:hypothetical protein
MTWCNAFRFEADLALASYTEFASTTCYRDIYLRTQHFEQHFEQHLLVGFVYHGFFFLVHCWRTV